MRMVGFQNRLVKLKPELAMNAEAEIPQLLDVNNLQPSQIDDSDQLIYGDEEEEEDDDDSQSASAISYSNQDINGNDGDDCALSRGGNQLLNNGGGGSAVGTPTSNAQLKLQSNRSHQIKALNSSPQANSPNGLNIGGNQEGRLQTGSFQHQTSNVSSSNSYATQNQGNPGQVGRSTFAQKRRSLSKQPRQLSKNSGQNGSPQVPQNQIRVLQPSPPTDPVTQTTNPVQNRRLLSVSHNQSGQFKFGSDIGRIPRLSGLKVAQNANGQSELLSSFVSLWMNFIPIETLRVL
ncbi:hypothetical protein FGO68_gene16254 [Halteria grandinella]|uniref:Uncharacterized protein n=1 Tax=Halteria grandinella TaxID=5974 RepID=A0A8J8NVW3_HALGN|nr:hypothetical protein FGO68_gene16254 [Halteria grandinella]